MREPLLNVRCYSAPFPTGITQSCEEQPPFQECSEQVLVLPVRGQENCSGPAAVLLLRELHMHSSLMNNAQNMYVLMSCKKTGFLDCFFSKEI